MEVEGKWGRGRWGRGVGGTQGAGGPSAYLSAGEIYMSNFEKVNLKIKIFLNYSVIYFKLWLYAINMYVHIV